MKTITTKDIAQRLQSGEKLAVIDVREDAEVVQGRIPGAKHIPLGELSEKIVDLDKAETYYLICHSGGRSGIACNFLEEQGYEVINIVDGMFHWEEEVEV